MNQEIKTLELAKVYESQGYFKDALDIYSFLDEQETSDEIKAGLKRMEGKLEEQIEERIEDEVQGDPSETKIANLFEEWLKLVVLKQRLDNFKRIKTRLA